MWMHNVADQFHSLSMEDQKVFSTSLDTTFMSTWGGDCNNIQCMMVSKLPAIQSIFVDICLQSFIKKQLLELNFLHTFAISSSSKHHKYVVKRYKYFLWYPIGLGVMDTLCCISLRSLAYFWCKMPMFKRVGMR